MKTLRYVRDIMKLVFKCRSERTVALSVRNFVPSLAPIGLFSYIIIKKNISLSAILVYRFGIDTDRHFAFLYDAISHVV